MEFTIAVINYGTGDLVNRFLDSLAETRAGSIRSSLVLKEVLVVDSGFPEVADAERFVNPAKYPWPVRIIPNSGHSYSSGVNKAMAEASTEWVFVSNSDVEVIDYGQLELMVVRASASQKIAVMCPQLLYPDGQWQRSYGDIPGLLEALKFALCWDVVATMIHRKSHEIGRHCSGKVPVKARQVGYADGAFLLLRKSIFEALGGFDESFRFYAEETDYALRVHHAGYQVCYLGVSPVTHVRGATVLRGTVDDRTTKQLLEAKILFMQKHHGKTYVELYKLITWVGAWWRAAVGLVMWKLTCHPEWRRRAEAHSKLARLIYTA